MITLTDYYKGRDVKYSKDLTEGIKSNSQNIVYKANLLLDLFGQSRKCTSGWRPKTVQMEINPRAPNSKHITGDAIDIEDGDGKLKEWCVFNQDKLEQLNLWMEDPESTPTWVHVQQVPPNSKKRIFKP